MKLLATLLLVLAACTDTPSGSSCPTTDTPTYQSFGQEFMTKYCTGCHSATAQNRHGAPQNTMMPDMSGPVHAAPTMEERAKLGQFLACEASSRN